jgi:plastocyanin
MNKRWIMGALTGVALAVTLTGCGSSDDAGNSASSAATAAATAASRAGEAASSAGSAAATAAAGAASAAATAVQSVDRATATPAGPQAVEIKMGDYFYEPKDVTVRPGTVRVTLPNSGPERPHTYAVKKLDGSADLFRSERVNTGDTQTVEFTVTEPGTYQVYCTLPGHADRGQTGTLVVRA